MMAKRLLRHGKPKPARRRTRLSVADRREQLLALGLRAFERRPYDAVSIDDIAAQAGISRGLLFHYFPTKHDYYVATLGRAAEQLLGVTIEGSEGRTPAERLDAGLRAYFRFVGERGASYTALLRGGVGSDPAVQGLVERTRQRFVDTVRDGLAPLVRDPASPRLRAALRGWIGFVEALALDSIEHRDVSLDELVDMAVRGIALVAPEAEAALDRDPESKRASRPGARRRR